MAALLKRDQDSAPETRKWAALILGKAADQDNGGAKPPSQSFSEGSLAHNQVKAFFYFLIPACHSLLTVIPFVLQRIRAGAPAPERSPAAEEDQIQVDSRAQNPERRLSPSTPAPA